MEKARREKPDLITLDISMPEESGVRFYRELKEDPELSGIPVVIVTGVTGYGYKPEDFQKFISSRKNIPPPEGFVPKPIDREELLKGVTALLS
jgi:CheY-like chemotaxis protein